MALWIMSDCTSIWHGSDVRTRMISLRIGDVCPSMKKFLLGYYAEFEWKWSTSSSGTRRTHDSGTPRLRDKKGFCKSFAEQALLLLVLETYILLSGHRSAGVQPNCREYSVIPWFIRPLSDELPMQVCMYCSHAVLRHSALYVPPFGQFANLCPEPQRPSLIALQNSKYNSVRTDSRQSANLPFSVTWKIQVLGCKDR